MTNWSSLHTDLIAFTFYLIWSLAGEVDLSNPFVINLTNGVIYLSETENIKIVSMRPENRPSLL